MWLEEESMDGATFDRLTGMIATAGTRRAALGALLAGAGSTLGLSSGQGVSAQPSCTPNGERCQNDAQCCSFRCVRRNNGKKVCKPAEHPGSCQGFQNQCVAAPQPCGTQSDGGACYCYVTIKGRSFCGFDGGSATCGCTSRKQCERRHGKGAKCINYRNCDGCVDTSTACLLPCPNLDPG
jgi:hypothetical protein